MKKIQTGDTVQLKSGGPIMTVKDITPCIWSIDDYPEVNCVYFNSSNNIHHQNFHQASLNIVEVDNI